MISFRFQKRSSRFDRSNRRSKNAKFVKDILFLKYALGSEKMKVLQRLEALTDEKEDKLTDLTEEKEELRQMAAQTTPSSSLHLQ